MKSMLAVAMGYLAGKIEKGDVTFEDLERFALADWSNAPDGQIRLTPDAGDEGCLLAFAGAAARVFREDIQRIGIERFGNVLRQFGIKLAQGEVTPATMALLCKCDISEFEPPSGTPENI